jgi:HEAT repeat protein
MVAKVKGHRKLLGIILALVALIVLSALWLESREPQYEGKSLTVWLQEWENGHGSPGTGVQFSVKTNVDNAIRQMGSKAVPGLRKMLRTRDSQFREQVVAYCVKRPRIPFHFRPSAYRLNIRGMFGIGVLGPLGQTAVPELLTLLEHSDWTIRAWAAGTLGKIGRGASPAVPDLIARLRDTDEHVRQAACGALVNVGASKEAVLPALKICLRDTNDVVFQTALETSSRLGADMSVLVPTITEQLNQKDPRVRYEAAMALAGCGEKGRSAIPKLLQAVHDGDKDVREAAAGALLKIDPSSAENAKVPPPPGPAADAGTGSITLELQGPTSIALDIYRHAAGVELDMGFPGPPPGFINVRATRPLSPKETAEFLEKALFD